VIAMKRLFLFLCIIGILISPVFAYVHEETAPAGQAVYVIQIYSEGGTTGSIELYQDNGDTITGSWSYSDWQWWQLPPKSDASITVGASTATTSFITGGDLITSFMAVYTNASVVKGSIGQTKFIANEEVFTTVDGYPVVKFKVTADKDVITTVRYIDYEDAAHDVNPETDTDLMEFLRGYWKMFSGIFIALVFWLKFLFVDNLTLVVVLYITGTMAYAINTSRNIFEFYKTWFRQQTAIFHFIADMFSKVISIITQILNIIIPF
jgi:hypothetical protein